LLSVKSPDGKYIACLYERDCGATTDTAKTVNIRNAAAKFDGGEARILIIKGKAKITLNWKNPQLLSITSDAYDAQNIFTQERKWKEVSIEYLSEK
jgi:hypothetical protein